MVDPLVDPAAEAAEKLEAPSAEIIQQLIYEHLVHNCYSETARIFGSACRLPRVSRHDALTPSHTVSRGVAVTPRVDEEGDLEMVDEDEPDSRCARHPQRPASLVGDRTSVVDVSLRTLEARKCLFDLVTTGRIAEAIEFCNVHFPRVLAADTPNAVEVYFQLQCQQFIECVRTSAPEALKFAQEELGKFGLRDPKYMDTLQDVVALIAYTDPKESPVAEYLSQRRRDDVATTLNSHILSFERLPSITALERIVRQTVVARDCLQAETAKDKKSKVVHSRWDLSTLIGPHSGPLGNGA